VTTFKRGDIIELDGLLAVVVGTSDDGGAPEDHLAVWFGDPQSIRISRGGAGGKHPEIWNVPVDYCIVAALPVVRH